MKSPNLSPASFPLLDAIRAGALLEESEYFAGVVAAIPHARAALAAAADTEHALGNSLDAFIAECSPDGFGKALLKAFDEEVLVLEGAATGEMKELGMQDWKVSNGDVVATVAEPALWFGIALGLCIAAGAGEPR